MSNTRHAEQKLVTFLDRDYILTSRGKCLGPIFPFYEDVDQLLFLIKSNKRLVEVLPDKTGVILTEENYDQDNSEKEPDIVFVKSIVLNHTEQELVIGGKLNLQATITPDNVTNSTLNWSVDNGTVASVVAGAVTAIKEGSAVITATAVDGSDVSAKCNVTVVKPKVETVTLDVNTKQINVGDNFSLTAQIAPENADKNMVWESSQPTVASVENGTVRGLSKGESVITAKSTDGSNKSATCTVTVTKLVENVKLDKQTLSLTINGKATLNATVTPSDASNVNVTWESSQPTVASVDNGAITAIAKGEATITVKTTDGNHTAQCAVTVTKPVTSVALDQQTLGLVVGGTAKLNANVTPSDASNVNVTWESSNSGIVKVDAGTITAIAKGEATITVKTADGNHTAQCVVTVTKPVASVALDKEELNLAVGGTAKLNANVTPSDASNVNVAWESSDSRIATVENGNVTAVNNGSANITVKTADGNHTAQCVVTVTKPVTSVTLDQEEATLEIGGTVKLNATVTPSDASNVNVTWESDNIEIATVENGNVTAVKDGSANITVKTVDGNHTAQCVVTVNAAATE